MKYLLKISNFSICIENKKILTRVNLSVGSGEIHVIMGPNGSGKSTLSQALIGHPAYVVKSGSIIFDNINITKVETYKRARSGMFLAFQYPYEIPGVTVFSMLKESYYAIKGKLISINLFQKMLFEKMDILKIDQSFAYRNLNEGFSGGEKKRMEMLQFLILKPKLAIFDEIDSGLDTDSLQIVAEAIFHAKQKDPSLSILLIAHYRGILKYLNPYRVHILVNGAISQSGDMELIEQVEEKGYAGFFNV